MSRVIPVTHYSEEELADLIMERERVEIPRIKAAREAQADAQSDVPVKRLATDLSPTAEVGTNEFGGKSTKLAARFDLIDPQALFRVAEVFGYGASKYTPDNWRAVPTVEHINHALVHLFAHLAGDTQDAHLDHAATRLIMAIAVDIQGRPWIIDADGTPRPQPEPAAA